MEDSQQGIEYLSKELSKNSFIKIKDSISTLIEGQLETQMKTKVYKDYFLIKIDPPFVAEKKSSPSRALICIFITIFGGLMSILYALIKTIFIKELKFKSIRFFCLKITNFRILMAWKILSSIFKDI